MILKLVRTPGIYLVGFMGSGKTTVGERLAERLGWSFTDVDREIECERQMAIAEIFARHGEEHFRAIEAAAIAQRLRMVRSGRPVVMALGGGAFTRPETVAQLAENGITIWLDCPLEVARARVEGDANRPLARDAGTFAELYNARRQFYALADYRVDSAGDPSTVVNAICSLPIF